MSARTEPTIKIAPAEEGIEHWKSKPDLPGDLKDRILKADIIIIPWNHVERPNQRVFPAETEQLYDFLKAELEPNISTEVYATDDEYCEIVLHSETIHLATIVFNAVVWPLLSGVISNYIYSKLKNRDTATVRFKAHVSRHKETITIEYEGPATAFQESMNKTISTSLQAATSTSKTEP